MASTMMELTAEARTYWLGPWNPNYHVTMVLRKTMDRLLPDNIHDMANGRLFISVTKVYDGTNTVCENFASKSELIHAITSSAFIPVFSGHLPGKYRGQRVIDGGFSSNLIQLSDDTITVAPFAGDADICPQDFNKFRQWNIQRILLADQGTDITLKNLQRLQHVLYPPSADVLASLLEDGFRDGHRFLRKQGLAPCTQCLTIRSRVVRLYRNNSDSNSSGESSQEEEEEEVDEERRRLERELAMEYAGDDMRCRDKTDCDEFNSQNIDLPSRMISILERFTSQAEQQFAEYRAQLNRRQQETLLGNLVRVFFNVVSYTPIVWFMRWGFYSTKAVTEFLVRLAIEVVPLTEYVSDKNAMKRAEELLGSLIISLLPEDRYTVVEVGKAPPTHRRRPRHNLDCDISITHLGGAMVENNASNVNEEEEGDQPLQVRVDGEDQQAVGGGGGDAVNEEDVEEEVEWLQVSVNATTDSRHHLRPRNEEEAKQFQAENLLLASRSGNVSRAVSRIGSRIVSRRSSVQSSAQLSLAGSRRQSFSSLHTNESMGNETLENIRRVTERTDAFLNYYYKDESGDLIMVNLYDISDTDPADILGDDVFHDAEVVQQHVREEDLAAIDPNEVERYRMRFQQQEEDFAHGEDNQSSDPESDWDRRRFKKHRHESAGKDEKRCAES